MAVLFSERVSRESAQSPANYSVDENLVKQATLQPGSRMAFLLLRDGIGPFFDRSLTTQGIIDQSGKEMPQAETLPIRITATGPAAVVTGTVRTARGEPVPNATIRLYQLIWYPDPITKIPEPRYALFTEKQGRSDGTYGLEYVFQNDDPGGPFQIEVVNPLTNEAGSLTTGVMFHGQRLQLDLFMKAKGSLSGVVRNEAGNPVGGATIQVITLADNRGQAKTTDASGTYSFSNLMVGAYSLKAVNAATLSEGSTMGTLPEDGTAVTQDVVVRRVADIVRGTVVGKVLGADGVTPRAGVIAIINGPNYQSWQRTTADGGFSFSGVYAGTIRITARDDSTGEQSESGGVISTQDQTIILNVIMKGTGSVTGLVKRDDGKSAEGLYVVARPSQGQARVLLTDLAGAFRVDNLPTGNVDISIIDPRDFNRTVASGTVSILSAGDVANIALFVPLKAMAVGTIQGTVYHRDGTPWANAPMKRVVNSFQYFVHQADADGKFSIPNLSLGGYTLTVISGSEVINASTDLWYDTQVRTLELRPVGIGTVTGTTWDDAAKTMPTGADVTLYSTKPNLVGVLIYDTDNPTVVKSDPQTGRFTFNGVMQGSFSVTSSNIFRPTPVSAGGKIEAQGQVVNVDLPLKGSPPVPGEPPPVNQPGSVSGRVLMPDGSAAGKDVRVTLTFGNADVTVTTDEMGLFRFAPIIPTGNQPIIAEDPATTLKWKGYAYVPSGLDVPITIKLLGRGSLNVKVSNADGTPSQAAAVSVSGSGYPNDSANGVTDAAGMVSFANLSEGSYAISATGTFGRGGRNQAFIPGDKANITAEVRLAPSATVTGRFLKADGVTPIAGGQITLKRNGQVIAYASSSSDTSDPGRYRMEFVPLGDFTVEGYDPVTERRGVGAGRLNADGEIITADVIVTPRGSVKGTVLNYGGTAPVGGAPVSISVSGVTGFSFSSVTAPDGGFFFSGVPAGRYTVNASDPGNGLSGQASGTLSYENETVTSLVHIAPTGSIAGRVLLPDGVTPVLNATVRLNGGSPVSVNAETAAFRYDNLAAGRSYTLTTSQPNTRRSGSAIATITRDLEVANGDIILGGVGTVSGVVFDSDGSTPLSGATVELRFNGGTLTSYTSGDGSFSFSDIPTGPFTLIASHTMRVTGSSVSGYLQNEGQVAALDLVLGPVASIKATVLLADGVTPSRGGGIRITTNTNRTLTGITDSNGQYLFSNIPIPCTISLYVEDAAGLGIGRAIGMLNQNGQLLELGPIVLDDKPIFVTSINPSSGAVNVPVNQTMRILFSEPADPATVTSSNLYLTQGSTRVAGALQLDADNSGATFTPSTVLKGFTLYTLVATDGITDLVGRKLALPQSISFTTVDNIPPVVSSISPAEGALQVASDAVVRLTFSEAVDPNSLGGITLSSGSLALATRTDLIQNGTVVALTPLEALAYNRSYTVSASGVRDMAGNVLSGTVQANFATIDTIPPTVTGITVSPTADLIKGNSVPVTAMVADVDVASVDFYLDDVLAGSVARSPFTLPILLAREGAIHIKAIAQDRVGNRGVAQFLDLDVKADQPPQVSFSSPAEGGSINTGAAFSVTLTGTDDLGVKDITLFASGEMVFSQTKTVTVGKSVASTFTLTAPTAFSQGGSIVLTAVARDTAGNASLQAQRTLMLRDSIAPGISLSSTGQTTRYKPGENASVSIQAGDNLGLVSVSCAATGAASASQTFAIDPPLIATTRSFDFAIQSTAAPHSVAVISCTASDAAGNSKNAALELTVADIVPPLVSSSSVSDNAVNVPTNAAITLSFNESLNPSTVTASTVLLAESVAGTPVPASVTLSGDHRDVTLKPLSVLAKGVAYTLTVSTAVADEAGNVLLAPYQLHFTSDNAVPLVESVTPATGSVNVPVGSAVSVRFNEQIDSTSVTADLVSLTSISGPVPGVLSVSNDGLSITFKPYNQLGFARAYTFTLKAGVRDVSGNAITGELTSTFTTQGPDSDLVGYWPMDGDWTDYSGNGNHGTAVNGATFSANKIVGTQAGEFDGVNDYVSFGDVLNMGEGNFTVSTWIYPVQIPSGTLMKIVNKGLTNSGTPATAGYGLRLVNDANGNKMQFMVYGVGTGNTLEVAQLQAGRWYNVVGVRDATQIRLYVDGVLANAADTGTLLNTNTNIYLAVGALSRRPVSAESEYFNGLIDEVAIYKRALADEDIFENYNAGLTTDRTPPSAPVVDPVASPTFSNQIVLRGTKEAGSSVRVNGKQIVAHDDNTTWQALYQLSLGQNLLDVSSHDLAGNVSPSVNLVVDLLPMNQKDASIVGLWHMDGDWKDYSGNGNHGIANNGATFSANKIFGSVSASFDGVDDYLSGTTTNFPVGNIARTISAWVKTTDSNGDKSVLHIGTPTGASPPQNYHLFVTGGKAAIGNGYGYGVVVGTTNIADSAWHLVTGVYEGPATNSAKIYVDGILQNSGTITTPATTSQSFTSGKFLGGGGQFNALIDELAVYSRALNAQEAHELYNVSPSMSLTSPGQTLKYKPGETGTATVTATNPKGIAKLYCNASGAASEGTQVVAFDPPQNDVTQQFTFRVAADATPYAAYRISCIAETASGVLGVSNLDLQAADLVPATVIGASIANNATGVIATLPISVSFNETMLASSLTSDTVQLRRADTGALVAGTSSLSTDGKTIIFTPAVALDCSTSYQFLIHGVKDIAGNIASDYSISFTTQLLTSVLIENKGSSAAPFVQPSGRYDVVTVKNSFVVFDGPLAADSMSVASSSTITHKATGMSGSERLELVVTGGLSIDGTSRIDVSARGYLGGYQGGNGAVGRTYGNTVTGGSAGGSGGSYGGYGGYYSGTINAVYGDLANPNESGSGGGTEYGTYVSGNGGGLVRIKAGSLALVGNILADGGNGNYVGGGGSGGGIRIDAGALSGSGYIYARGGWADNSRGGGGGGRIAIYYGTMDLPSGNVIASGAGTGYNGGAGTVYLKSTATGLDHLIVDNRNTDAGEGSTILRSLGSGVVSAVTADTLTASGATWAPGSLKGMRFAPDASRSSLFTVIDNDATSLRIDPLEGDLTQATANGLSYSGVYSFTKVSVLGKGRLSSLDRFVIADELLLDGSTLVANEVTANKVTLKGGGLLSHWRTTLNQTYRLDLNVTTDLNIESGSRIDVSGRGYLGAYQSGNGTVGRTNGNTVTGGSAGGSGGSYGGYGGYYAGVVNAVYGDPTNPNESGSGGGTEYGTYVSGNGGGLVRVKAGTLTLAGNILADGGNGNYVGGGGSGGGIRIDVGALSGAGYIYARGGWADNNRGGGGGGRIAIYYGTMELPQSNVVASGAATSYPGGAGTVRFSLLP
ncbi:MAG: Ig-like domain-containing protein [Geobacteraceae bacterium]|nr:Ig-like domain-containing protein [Geobacteraceae bacterium]